MTPAARARARRGEGGLLRDEILAAVDDLLIETASEEAVSIRAIADRVGVTPPSIYRHFADKDELIFAVCERTFAQLDAAMQKAAIDREDPIDSLEARGRMYVEFALAHPEHYRVFFLSSVKEKETQFDGRHLKSEVVAGSQAFNGLVDACARVLGRRRSPSPVELACEVWAFLHGVTALRINFPTMPWPPVEAMIASYMDGLRARLTKQRSR